MGRNGTRQQARTEATRGALMAAARSLFGSQGFHAANIEDITRAASVTKGALYHHFRDKTALFEAVSRQVAEEVIAAGRRGSEGVPHEQWAWAKAAFEAHLRAVAENPDVQRILLVDGPAVLGPRRWRALQAEVMVQEATDFMARQQEAGRLAHAEPGMLARLILAAMNEAAFIIADADDPEAARLLATEALLALADGLAVNPSLE